MSRIVLIGGHGKISRILTTQLVDNGDEVVSVFRNADHASDIAGLGAEPVVCDIETASVDDLVPILTGADAVVFAAGAGPGSSAERKHTVDYEGSVKSAAAAERAGVSRFVQISAMGIDGEIDTGDDVWAAYVAAKRNADIDLKKTSLAWTILRPGALTDDEPTGMVKLEASTGKGSIPRADVAALVAAALTFPETAGFTWEAISGETPIAAAVAAGVSAG
ncbi:NAD(P)H-binding protein [Mycetocola zhadangensis]|uniref:NAD(P)-dependent oxidoreductase n=1 Tax=Mycetocola zhadangensis TaxID=1164595 RepID=A0A3L7J2B6_9MICO|nr:NAD(P)H-binding protein [Mycetocola zhadangensis]RLQ84559.1 NAD(P)-dependent oxidoreductase [Mycetocola zhadangensis]GGE91882.1 NAD-dependent dehydratase [Mycetocola zhadangensis]